MKIKLSDYILEQSISEADTTDILLEQAMSELEVCTSLAYAYLKQLTMEEYMNPDGELTAEDVVTEASAEAAADGEEGGGVGAAVSNIGKGFAGFFKAVIGAITGFFRWVGNKIGQIGDKVTKNGKQLAQKVEAATEEELQTIVQKLAATKKRDIAAIYYSYNPSNVKTFYDTLDTSSRRFAQATDTFVKKMPAGLSVFRKLRDENSKKGIAILDEYSREIQEFTDSIKRTNPADKKVKDIEASTKGFKAMVIAYIQYYSSAECASRLRSIREAVASISKKLADFDSDRRVYKGENTGDGIHNALKRDMISHTNDPAFARTRQVLASAMKAVSNDKDGALGVIKDLDGNLNALNHLGKSHYADMEDESRSKFVKGKTPDGGKFNALNEQDEY